MSDSKYSMYLWKQHKEYYTQQDGNIIFKEDTPQEILDSYQAYKDQMDRLTNFPTSRSKGGILSMFDKSNKSESKKTTVSENVELAKQFIAFQNEEKEFSVNALSNDFIFIHYDKKLGTSLSEVNKYTSGYQIQECFKKQDKVCIMWKQQSLELITVFWFDEKNKMKRIQEYICQKL